MRHVRHRFTPLELAIVQTFKASLTTPVPPLPSRLDPASAAATLVSSTVVDALSSRCFNYKTVAISNSATSLSASTAQQQTVTKRFPHMFATRKATLPSLHNALLACTPLGRASYASQFLQLATSLSKLCLKGQRGGRGRWCRRAGWRSLRLCPSPPFKAR